MPRATLALEVPEGSWIHAVSTDHPETVFRVVAVLPGRDGGTALAELRTPDPVPALAAIDRQPDIESFELLWQYDDRALVQLQTSRAFLLGPVADAGVPVETPFDIRNAVVELSLTTSNDRLSALAARLDEAGLRYETRTVLEAPGREGDRLTERQRETVLAAVESGYYRMPREATLTEVAGEMGIAKATASDLLHRAESKLVDWYLEEHPSRALVDP